MQADRPPVEIFIEGIDVKIRLDLGKHKALLTQAVADRGAFRVARDHESQKKRHYHRQIGKGKFNDDALRESVKQIRINIRHLSDKEKLAQDKIDHEKLIVETLTAQLADYDRRNAALH